MKIACDYLVIGAGAASLAFIDTLLTELPSTRVVLVDRKKVPGGHWSEAYDYVRLHQPSIVYGLGSKQLEGKWSKLILKNWMMPWHHRATKEEIVTYFGDFVSDKVKTGQIQYYPECDYDFRQTSTYGDGNGNGNGNEQVHSFSSLDGKELYEVTVGTKVVNGVVGECKVPSKCPVNFPVDDGVNLVTPNQLFEIHHSSNKNNSDKGGGVYEKIFGRKGSGTAVSKKTSRNKHYVVLGCGKTAMDTVVFLQTSMSVCPDNISLVIPNDVWMTLREGGGNPWTLGNALLDSEGDTEKALLGLEEKGMIVRIDENIMPTKFRFPIIGKDELKKMRLVKDMIRRGRVTSIVSLSTSSSPSTPSELGEGRAEKERPAVAMKFGSGQEDWTSPVPPEDCVFVHCTSPGPFNGFQKDGMFDSERQLDLRLLFAPPVSASMACLAYVEVAREKGTLDVEFATKLFDVANRCTNGKKGGKNQILDPLLKPMPLGGGDAAVDGTATLYQSMINLAVFFAIINKDPNVGYKWMKGNRLSMLSVPGFKCKAYESMSIMASKGKSKLGFSDDQIEMIALLRDRLKPLEGL